MKALLLLAQTWSIGHSYSSPAALRLPATLVAVRAASGGAWLSKLDAGVLARLPTGAGFGLELGVRASGGSVRSRTERVYSAMARTDWSFSGPGIGMALGAEYEADGGFDVKKLSAGAELTPLGWGAAGLGRFTHRTHGFRWRPWIGGAVVADDVFRGHARVEAVLRVPVGALAIEGSAEATAWYRDGFNGTNYATAALSAELGGSGVSLTLSADEGRRPPLYLKTSKASVGLGLRLPSPSRR